MRDGTTLSGTVTATSASDITLTGDDNSKHTVPMAQVRSIEYDDAPAAQTSTAQSSPAASGGVSSGGSAPSSSGATPARRSSASRAAAKAREDAAHEEHYHPTQDEIHTKTYVL